MKYEPVIGLEIHIELSTKSKMFCSCSADYFGKEPNTHTCPICLGLPGAMPYANQKAIEFVQKLALALNCKILLDSKFDRKNYFYPDLPKGFQISQYDLPFSQKGFLKIQIGQEMTKKIDITRVHLEEDTGKLSHAVVNNRRVTLIDFNRSGIPLIEIVTEPDLNSAIEAKIFAQKLQQIVRYLKISDADMEKGSMRIEPNISLREKGDQGLPNYKVELKNINSFKFAEKAINFEIERQSQLLESNKTPIQETRGWNEFKNETISQRSKEFAHDYRYFPEPDLPPFTFNQNYINRLNGQLPELPDSKVERFQKKYLLSSYDIEILTREIDLADYFEEAVKIGEKHNVGAKQIANMLINQKIDRAETLPAKLIQTIVRSTQKTQLSQEKLGKIIREVLHKNSKAVTDYKNGKQNVMMFLVGQVMRQITKKVDPKVIREAIEKMI